MVVHVQMVVKDVHHVLVIVTPVVEHVQQDVVDVHHVLDVLVHVRVVV